MGTAKSFLGDGPEALRGESRGTQGNRVRNSSRRGTEARKDWRRGQRAGWDLEARTAT